MDIESLYTRYGPMVLRRCRHLLGSEEYALEAMQDTFVKLLQKSSTLTAAYPAALLYRIATNICLNRMRYDKMSRELPESDTGIIAELLEHSHSPEERITARVMLDKILGRAIDELTLTAAMYHYVDGINLEQTAALLNVSVSTVRYRLRNLQKISKKFRRTEYDD